VVYYLLIHMGQQGLVFVYLPALLLLSAAGLEYLVMRLHAGRIWTTRTVAALLVGANAVVFLFAPTYPLGTEQVKLLTRDTLRLHDAEYLPRLAAVQQGFDPQSTILLSGEWRFPQYYLPAYTLVPYALGARWEVGDGQPDVPEATILSPSSMGLLPDAQGNYYLVILDDDLVPFNESASRQEQITLSTGEPLVYLRLHAGEGLALGTDGYTIVAISE
jgi:hypothetical protein